METKFCEYDFNYNDLLVENIVSVVTRIILLPLYLPCGFQKLFVAVNLKRPIC